MSQPRPARVSFSAFDAAVSKLPGVLRLDAEQGEALPWPAVRAPAATAVRESLGDPVGRFGLRTGGTLVAALTVHLTPPSAHEASQSVVLTAPRALEVGSAERLLTALLRASEVIGCEQAIALVDRADDAERRFWQTAGFMPQQSAGQGAEASVRRLALLSADRAVRRLPDDVLDTPFDGLRATLLFVVQGERVLLIHKKRGHGAGKINGPGGKCEPGESPRACAVREVEEELCIRVRDVTWSGELRFVDAGGERIHGFVYTASNFDGVPTETDEAAPLWYDLEQVPYERMWADDRMWLPWVLAGEGVHAAFLTDGDEVVAGRLRFGAPPEPAR